MSIYLAICFENPKESYRYLQFQYNTMGFILVSFSFPTETPFSGSEKPKPYCLCMFAYSLNSFVRI